MSYCRTSQRVVSIPVAAAATPGSLEMQISSSTESETQEMRPSSLQFNKPSRCIWFTKNLVSPAFSNDMGPVETILEKLFQYPVFGRWTLESWHAFCKVWGSGCSIKNLWHETLGSKDPVLFKGTYAHIWSTSYKVSESTEAFSLGL